jgi:hypothetical protein
MKHHWSPEHIARRDVVLGLAGKSYETWTKTERGVADEVCLQISQIGFLLRNSYTDRNAFLDFWAPWCVRIFVIAAPMIADERVKMNAPDEYIHFEWLARKACRYMKRKPWWESRAWAFLKKKTSDLPDPAAMQRNWSRHRDVITCLRAAKVGPR